MSGITGIENSKGYAVPLEKLDYLGQVKIEQKAPSRFGIDDEDRLHGRGPVNRNEYAEDARRASSSRLLFLWIRRAIRLNPGTVTSKNAFQPSHNQLNLRGLGELRAP